MEKIWIQSVRAITGEKGCEKRRLLRACTQLHASQRRSSIIKGKCARPITSQPPTPLPLHQPLPGYHHHNSKRSITLSFFSSPFPHHTVWRFLAFFFLHHTHFIWSYITLPSLSLLYFPYFGELNFHAPHLFAVAHLISSYFHTQVCPFFHYPTKLYIFFYSLRFFFTLTRFSRNFFLAFLLFFLLHFVHLSLFSGNT